MVQIEVYEFLKKERKCKNEKFFSYREVWKGLENNFSYTDVRLALIKLYNFGYLEIMMTGKVLDWQRTFRLKKKYLNTK